MIPARLERATHSLEGCCSIQLSYGTKTIKERGTHPEVSGLLYSRKSFPPSAELDFRGSSKNIANQRFAVFRDQLSYGTKTIKEHGTHPEASGLLYSRKSFPPSAELDFRGSSFRTAERDQLSYGTAYRLQKYIFFKCGQEKTSHCPLRNYSLHTFTKYTYV